MAFQHKENSGTLFKNEKKEKDSQPDYQGDCMVNGQMMRIAAWVKKEEGKKPRLSLKFDAPRDDNRREIPKANQSPHNPKAQYNAPQLESRFTIEDDDGFDSDIPF